MKTKRCSKCHELKEHSEFNKHTGHRDGLRSECKTCCAAYLAGWRAKHREEKAAYDATYRAEHRAEIRAYGADYDASHRKKRATYYAEHREEKAAYDTAYRIEHRSQIASKDAKWRKANPDKARAKHHRRRARKRGNGGSHTARDIQRQGDCQEWRCWWCNRKCKDKYHIDHLIPLAKGGHNDPGNIVITCPACNLKKHDKLPHEFCDRLL